MRKLYLIALMSLPLCGYAAEEAWDVGLAVNANQSPFVGGDTLVSVRPVSHDTSGFDLEGLTWSFKQTPQHELYLGAGLDDWDHKRGDSAALSDMHPLDRAINVRMGSAWKTASGVTSIDLAQDLTAHKGTQAKLRYTYNPAPHHANIRPYVEAQWLSAKVSDYYVGVNANEAKANRPAYQAGAAMAVKTGVTLERALTKRVTLLGGINATHYSNAISDSPIVAHSTVWGGYTGLTYRW